MTRSAAFPLLSTGTALLALVGAILPFEESARALAASPWLARLELVGPTLVVTALFAVCALAATRYGRVRVAAQLAAVGAAGALAGIALVISRPGLLIDQGLLVALAGH